MRVMMQRKPTSPGKILSEEFLKPLELSQKELARHLDCDYKVINRIVSKQLLPKGRSFMVSA